MKYFEKFPFIDYPYYGKLVENSLEDNLIEFVTTIDLNVRFAIENSILQNPSAYYTITWLDEYTPEKLAFYYYGSYYYDWVVMLSNSSFDFIYDFPMKLEALEAYIENKYEIDILESYTMIHHYEDIDGYIIDENTYNTQGGNVIYVYEYEESQNEARREIKLIDRSLLEQINDELDNRIFQIKNLRATNANSQ